MVPVGLADADVIGLADTHGQRLVARPSKTGFGQAARSSLEC